MLRHRSSGGLALRHRAARPFQVLPQRMPLKHHWVYTSSPGLRRFPSFSPTFVATPPLFPLLLQLERRAGRAELQSSVLKGFLAF